MDCFIYISSIEFYAEIRNDEFFDVISEYFSNGWIVTSECLSEDDTMFIAFYAEKNHVKIEIGYLSSHNF